MLSYRIVFEVLRAPERVLREQLAHPAPLRVQMRTIAIPAASIRAIAVLARSFVLGSTITGVVLGVGGLLLQIGTWLSVGLALPALARQFDTALTPRQGLVIVALASVPLWLAGALYAVPEDIAFLFYWSRSLVVAVALYGVYIIYRGLSVAEVPKDSRLWLTAAASATYLAVYLVLFTFLGLLSHVILFLVGTSS